MTTIQQKTSLKFVTAMMLAGASMVSSLYAIAVVNQGVPEAQTFAMASATTYYVDSASGNDSKDGRSEANAWKSIQKVNNTVLKAGDRILFKRGGNWNEKLVINGSGISGSPIVVASYGTGNRPVIDGQNVRDFNIFIQGREHITISDLAVKRAKSDSGPSAGVAIADSNYIVLDNLEITENYGSGGVFLYVSQSNKGVGNVIKNSVVSGTKGTAFTGQENRGNGIFFWADCNNCGRDNLITNNTITSNGDHGVGIFFGNNVIAKNTISGNGYAGVGVGGDKAANNIIEGNTISQNCKTKDDCFGINLFRVGSGNIIRYNVTDGQHDTLSDSSVPINSGYDSKFGTGGIRFDGGDPTLIATYGYGWDFIDTTGNKIYYNQISNEIDGIQIFNHSNIEIYNNTVYNSKRSAIFASAYNTINNGATQNINITLRNNLLSGLNNELLNKSAIRPLIEPNYALLTLANVVGTSNYNLFNPNSNLAVKFNGNAITRPPSGVSYTSYTLAGWQSATNQDRQSIAADPLFELTPNNLRISVNSPAIDKGSFIGLVTDIVGSVVPQGNAVDIGAYEITPAPACIESWSCSDWGECINGKQTRNCVDANNCGTVEFRPILDQECVMPACIESWSCSDWGECINGKQTRNCVDTNNCDTINNQPALSQTCTVACIPNCSGKNCGNDGCGGSCGSCSTNQTCESGVCQSAAPVYDNAYCSSKYGRQYVYDSQKDQCCKKLFGISYSCKKP